MGQIESVEIGAKSTRREDGSEGDVDFKDPKNSSKAKKELYNLFLEDKLILASSVIEAMDRLENLQAENKRLKTELDKSLQSRRVDSGGNETSEVFKAPTWVSPAKKEEDDKKEDNEEDDTERERKDTKSRGK